MWSAFVLCQKKLAQNTNSGGDIYAVKDAEIRFADINSKSSRNIKELQYIWGFTPVRKRNTMSIFNLAQY